MINISYIVLYFLYFLSTQPWTMLMQRLTKSMTIVEMALSVWAIIHLADAFDHCDVRHKFTNDKGKYLSNCNNSKCFFYHFTLALIYQEVVLKYYNIS